MSIDILSCVKCRSVAFSNSAFVDRENRSRMSDSGLLTHGSVCKPARAAIEAGGAV